MLPTFYNPIMISQFARVLAAGRQPKLRRGERGAVLILVAILLPVLIGFLALAVDVGYLYSMKRKYQTVADAAALACAQQMQRATPCTYRNGANNVQALDLAAEYGLSWGDVNTSQPADNQVSISLTRSVPTFFMKVLGLNTVSVVASATAEMTPTCLYTLNPSGINSLNVQPASGNDMPACGSYVNSNHSTSAFNAGAGSTFNALANSIWVVGGRSGSGTVSPIPRLGVAPIGDPLVGMPNPTITAGCDYTNRVVTAKTTLTPGNYCNGIRIATTAAVNFNPGLYVLKGGGLTAQANSNLIGTDVTFYNTAGEGFAYGPINIAAGGTTIRMSAPTTGNLKGILFFQDRSIAIESPASIFGSGAGSYNHKLAGALYFPTTGLSIQSGSNKKGGVGAYSYIVAYDLQLFGLNYFNYQAGDSWATLSGPVRLVQ